jgi:hypothetical protein
MALHKLHAELANASDVIKRPHDYVAKIAAARFKTSLIETDLAANQIWNLVFDIRRAAQKRRAARRASLVECRTLNVESETSHVQRPTFNAPLSTSHVPLPNSNILQFPTFHVPPSTFNNPDCKEAP